MVIGEVVWYGLVVLATRQLRFTKHIQTLRVSEAFIADSFDHSEPLRFVAGHFCFSQKSVFELYLDCLTKERQSAMK